MKNLKVGFKKLNDNAILPAYSREGDACLDITSMYDYVINPGETMLVRTGLAVELPHGYKLSVKPRSGLALKHSITVLNTPGTVDAKVLCFEKVYNM